MAKLDELLGKYLPEWPDGADFIVQDASGQCWPSQHGYVSHRAGKWSTVEIDGADFRLKEVADDFMQTQVTQPQYLAARDRITIKACEELPRPDLKLWKRAALAAFAGYCARPGMDAECAAEEAMFAADAFMNAMEKHLSSN